MRLDRPNMALTAGINRRHRLAQTGPSFLLGRMLFSCDAASSGEHLGQVLPAPAHAYGRP